MVTFLAVLNCQTLNPPKTTDGYQLPTCPRAELGAQRVPSEGGFPNDQLARLNVVCARVPETLAFNAKIVEFGMICDPILGKMCN